jgi:ABC-type transport system involved in Fe-S cluster assembly fused permease/ATPase subunit
MLPPLYLLPSFPRATLSPLQHTSEAVVQEALDRLMAGRTVLVVAHRLSTIRGADRIILIQVGKGRARRWGGAPSRRAGPAVLGEGQGRSPRIV